MQNNQIIGYSRFKSKNGNEVMFVDVARMPTANDVKWGRVGMKVEQLWIPSSCFYMFDSTVVGKVLKATYEISNGRANVVDVAFE